MIDRKILFIVLVGISVVGIALLVYFLTHRQNNTNNTKKSYQYVGANNCVTKVIPDDGMKGYDNQAECQKNEYVNNGWKMVNTQGSSKHCLSSKTGKKCKEGSEDCICYQNKVCIQANGKKISSEAPLMEPCKIGDDDCFLTQYGCWKSQNKKRWKCTARGDGCTLVDCDPGDTSCFDSKVECLQRCKGYCSENHGCIQTTNCVLHKGDWVTVDPNGKPIPGSPCHENIKECVKTCKSVTCAYEKGSDPNDPTRRKACRWGICDKGDSKCLTQEWKTDPRTGKQILPALQKCLLKDCAPYECDPNIKMCYIRNGNPANGDFSGKPPCDPILDPDSCFLGIDECAKNCAGTKNKWKCVDSYCYEIHGTDKERKKKCKGIDCYESLAECQSECDTGNAPAYSCFDDCQEKNNKCPQNGFSFGLSSAGGPPVCFKTKSHCKKSCKKMDYTMFNTNDNNCVTLKDKRRCDLINDPTTCFPDANSCKLLHRLF